MTAYEIIRALGGTTRVAQALAINRSAVSNWPTAGIPTRHWLRLARLAAASDDPVARAVTLDHIEHHVVGPASETRKTVAA